ncbi:hypothetical protein [Streptomyces sp. NPDC059918]|uniref:hypothetical protein n=1 Tax=unclassified Streptomyces TaxID=2593676 RepID=UPI003662E0CE
MKRTPCAPGYGREPHRLGAILLGAALLGAAVAGAGLTPAYGEGRTTTHPVATTLPGTGPTGPVIGSGNPPDARPAQDGNALSSVPLAAEAAMALGLAGGVGSVAYALPRRRGHPKGYGSPRAQELGR